MCDNCSCTNNNTTRCNGLSGLSISGSSSICAGTPQIYTISNTSYGTTWSITSGSSHVTISYSDPSQITLTLNSGYSGVITLNANIYGSLNITKTIVVGIPYAGFNIESYPYEEPECYEVWSIYSFQATAAWGPGSTGFEWGHLLIGGSDVISPYDSPYFTFIPEQDGNYEIFVKPRNACDVVSPETKIEVEVLNYCGGFRLKNPKSETPAPKLVRNDKNIILSPENLKRKPHNITALSVTEKSKKLKKNATILFPNPVTGNDITIQIAHKQQPTEKLNTMTRSIILVESTDGIILSQTSFDSNITQIKIDVSGLKNGFYLVRIKNGSFAETQKMVIAR